MNEIGLKRGPRSPVRKILIIFSIVLVIILTLPLVFILVAFRIAAHLSVPTELEKAKELGEELAAVRNLHIIVVVAHPDDVDWYIGGTLASLHQNGNKITVVLGTSGEKGRYNTQPGLEEKIGIKYAELFRRE